MTDIIPNGTGAEVRANINNEFETILGEIGGSSVPTDIARHILVPVSTSNVSSTASIPSGSLITNVTTFIEGSYLAEVGGYSPLVPTLTSNNAQGYTITVSQAPVHPGYYAFAGDEWSCYGSVGWLTIELPQPTIITQYSEAMPGTYASSTVFQAPSSWTFQGSNDGTNWTVLDTQVGVTGWELSTTRYFPINNTQAFSYYQFNLTQNNGNAYTSLFGMQLYTSIASITTLEVNLNGSTPLSIQSTSQNTPSTIGVYPTVVNNFVSSANAGVVEVVVGGSPTSGSAKVVVEYISSFLS